MKIQSSLNSRAVHQNQIFTLDSHLQNGPTQFVSLWIWGFPRDVWRVSHKAFKKQSAVRSHLS